MAETLQCLMDEFIERCRNGESPVVAEYAKRLPGLADEILATFPMLKSIEFAFARSRRPSDDESLFSLPERFGDYRVVRPVGRGGMGIVVEAIQESLGRRVALKVLPPNHVASHVQVERFRHEALAAARLNHPNIVPVYGVGLQSGIHYLVMQFIEGVGLDRVIASSGRDRGHLSSLLEVNSASSSCEKINCQRAVEIVANVADALAYAHEHGVTHRDVKPSNLLLDNKGEIWLLDFGLSKLDDTDQLTSAGDVVGTLRYLAPERLRGEFDARSDIYSLGLTLYELLTRRPAFHDVDRVRLLRRIADEEPTAPRTIDPSVPRDLDTIVRKAIAKEPERRYQTAREFLKDLHHFLDGRPISVRRASSFERLYRWGKRNPAVAGLTAVVFGLLFAAAISALAIAGWLARENQRAIQSQRRAEVAERSARDQLFESFVNQAQLGRSSGKVGQRIDGLVAISKAARLAAERGDLAEQRPRLRRQAVACLSLPDIEPIAALPADQTVADVVADARLGAIAFTDSSHRLWVCVQNVDGIRRVHRIGGDHDVSLLAMSQDGRRIAVTLRRGDTTSNRVIDLVDDKPIVDSEGSQKRAWTRASFSSDGSRLAFVSAEGFGVLEVSTGRLLSLVRESRVRSIAWSPDDQRIATGSGIQVDFWSTDLKSERRSFTYRSRVRAVAWSEDAAQVAVACDDEIVVHGVSRGSWDLAFRGHGGGVDHLAFVPGSRWIASTGMDATTRLWDVTSCREILAIEGYLGGVAQQGQRILLRDRDGQLHLGRIAGAGERVTLYHPRFSTSVTELVFLPDSNHLALSDKKGLLVWATGLAGPPSYVAIGPTSETGLTMNRASLLTHGAIGLASWPIKRCDSTLSIGPPTIIADRPAMRGGIDATSPSGRVIRVESSNRFVVMDGATGAISFHGSHPDVRHVAIHPLGHLAVSNGMGGDSRLWDLEAGTWRLLDSLGHARFAFSRDGQRVVGSFRDHVTVWSADGMRVLSRYRRKESGGVPPATFVSDSGLYATTSGRGQIVFVESDTGREVLAMDASSNQPVVALAWDQGGKRLATALEDGSIDVWDLSLVRAGLQELQLDDDDLFWTSRNNATVVPALSLKVDLGSLANHPRVLQQSNNNARELLENLMRPFRDPRERPPVAPAK